MSRNTWFARLCTSDNGAGRSFRLPRSVASIARALVVGALVLYPVHLEAQVLEPGARVRVTQANGFRQQGTFQGVDADSARLTASRGTAVAIPLTDVAGLEVSMGRQRRFWRNLGVTAAAAAFLGGGVAASTYEPCDEYVLFGCLLAPASRSEAFMWGALVGGALGVPAGVVVGAALRHETWAPVNHPSVRPRQVSVRPILGNRLGAAATLQF